LEKAQLGDLSVLLDHAHPLLRGISELGAGRKWFTPTIEAIQIAQMVTQAVWGESSRMGLNTQMLQLPHFTEELNQKLGSRKWKIQNLHQFLKLEPEKRKEFLMEAAMTEDKIRDVENVCKLLPMDVEFNCNIEVDDEDEEVGITAGSIATVVVTFERPSYPKDDKLKDEPILVHAPYFPEEKFETWWVILADDRNNLLGMNKVPTLRDQTETKVQFLVPKKPGQYHFNVHAVSDSYCGFDKRKLLKVKVSKEIIQVKQKHEDDDEDDEASHSHSEDEEDREDKEEREEKEDDDSPPEEIHEDESSGDEDEEKDKEDKEKSSKKKK